MPLAGVITTHLQDHATRTGIGVYVGNVRRTDDVDWDRLVVTDSGSNAAGRVAMVLFQALTDMPELVDQQRIRVVDHDAGEKVIQGYVISRRPIVVPTYTETAVIASDNGSLLDDAFIAYESRPPESMKARIAYLWGYYATHDLSRSQSFVASIGGTLPAQELVSLTLRQAVEAVISQASSAADFYVDAVGRLHVFTSESNDAPFNVSDSAGVGEIEPENLHIDYDAGSYLNGVYVQGQNAAGSGYFYDHAAIARANGVVRTGVLQAPDCTTAAMARNLAQMYLGRVSSGKPRGSFETTGNDGWHAGQNLTVMSVDHGLTDEEFRIHRVTMTIAVPGDEQVRHYHVEFGGVSAGGSTTR